MIYAADGRTVLATNVQAQGRRPDALLPPATRSAGSPRRSSATRRRCAPAPGSSESMNDYLTGVEHEPRHACSTRRSTSSRATTVTGNDVAPDDRRRTRSASRQRARRQLRRRGRDRADDRARARDGARPDLRPEPDRGPLQPDRRAAALRLAAPLLNRATQGLYVARLDVQDRHGGGGARHRQVHADSTFDDPGYCNEYGKQVYNSPTRAARRFRHASRSPRRSQHSINSVFCNIGKQLGAQHDPRLRQEVRLLLEAAARDAGRRARGERPVQERHSSSTRRPTTRSTRAGSRSARSGCW